MQGFGHDVHMRVIPYPTTPPFPTFRIFIQNIFLIVLTIVTGICTIGSWDWVLTWINTPLGSTKQDIGIVAPMEVW